MNHFIEIGYNEKEECYIIIHSGSRGLGHTVASHYMKIASGTGKATEGHVGLDVNSEEGKNYIKDMEFCLEFALANRKEMVSRVISILNSCFNTVWTSNFNELINRNHNHAELKDGLWIHRKGATHAEEGMMGVIPGNMRDGSFIVRGKGCSEALYSSSHGAGRVMGRKQAKAELSLDEFKESMLGITGKIDETTLDESCFAYKDIFEVMRLQEELVEVIDYIKPLINVKG